MTFHVYTGYYLFWCSVSIRDNKVLLHSPFCMFCISITIYFQTKCQWGYVIFVGNNFDYQIEFGVVTLY